MRILADENIPLVEAFFADFGSIRRMPGRAIDAAAVKDCELLLVRSVTPVNQALLQGSAVRFVGTCTIGTDHLDLAYLQASNIAWSSAPGCNARGVVDYILSSILTLAEDAGVDPASRHYGVIGAGQVGGRLVKVLQGLGWSVKVCDPPRQRSEGGDFVCLEEILGSCDVISLHTPLQREGDDATWHLFNAERLAALRPGTWLLNASRGAVVDNAALLCTLQQRSDLQVVLDVWEGEPQADPVLAQYCRLATPHIAGYSLDGKLRGTEQIYQAVCGFLKQPVVHRLQSMLPPQALPSLVLGEGADPRWVLPALCRLVYDPRRDDADFRRSLQGGEQQRRLAFDALRKNYPVRRELDALKVSAPGALQGMLQALGIECLS